MTDIRHFSQIQIDDRPWLIVGKGPTLANWSPDMKDKYNVFCMNQSIWVTKYADILHFIDYEYYEHTTTKTDITYKTIVMPWRPHIKERSTGRCLEDLSPNYNNLYSYDLSTSNKDPRYKDKEIIHANFSSAQAAFNILGEMGVKNIDTIGVDGTKSRFDPFKDLKIVNEHVDTTPQFNLINDYVKKYNIKWTKL